MFKTINEQNKIGDLIKIKINNNIEFGIILYKTITKIIIAIDNGLILDSDVNSGLILDKTNKKDNNDNIDNIEKIVVNIDATEDNECNICYEKFKGELHKKIGCPGCKNKVCKQCFRQSIIMCDSMSSQCTVCSCELSRTFILKNLGRSFIAGRLREHRKRLLFNTEKARLIDTIPFLKNYEETRRLKKQKKIIESELENTWTTYKDDSNIVNYEHYRQTRIKYSSICRDYSLSKAVFDNLLTNKNNNKDKKKRFIHPCSQNGCKGFLSKSWKCYVCSKYTCNKCLCKKEKDNHICKKIDIESAELIKKETKNCPNCGTRIYKIDGCDQIWCTQCHVAFSWKTGKKTYGRVHNPHYFKWKRENQGKTKKTVNRFCNPREPPSVDEVEISIQSATRNFRKFNSNYNPLINHIKNQIIIKIQRLTEDITHFYYTDLENLRNNLNTKKSINNLDLRLRYAAGEIPDSVFSTTLLKRDNKNLKNTEILHVYDLVSTIVNEQFANIINSPYNTFFQLFKFIIYVEKIIDYANNQLNRIRICYNNSSVLNLKPNRIRLDEY
jgi:hypothetical protein